MKKWTVAIGLVILIVGLLLISSWNMSQEITEDQNVMVEGKWDISSNFQKGETVTLGFSPTNDWSLLAYEYWDEPPYSRKYLSLNVTNTVTNSYTLFEAILAPPGGVIPEPPYMFLLTLYDVILVEDDGGIAVGDGPDFDPTRGILLGTAKNDGVHVVHTSLFPPYVIDKHLNGSVWPHPASPPSQLILYRVTTETIYPYTFLLPIGSSLGIIGIIMSIWGIKSKVTRKSRFRKVQLR